ncbi:hypothetical protein LINPERHAP2_LOCUS1221, partial [Linum perenne]
MKILTHSQWRCRYSATTLGSDTTSSSLSADIVY